MSSSVLYISPLPQPLPLAHDHTHHHAGINDNVNSAPYHAVNWKVHRGKIFTLSQPKAKSLADHVVIRSHRRSPLIRALASLRKSR